VTTPIADCDVHCAVPSRDALFPYLSEHWREWMLETHYKPPAAIENAYPSWSPMLATPPVSLEQVQQDVLGRAAVAVLHCYFAVESYTHPYLSSALATAVNQWLADEWLDRDDRLLGSATIAPEHTTQAVEEVRRVAEDPRFVQVVVPVRTAEPYGTERFWPVWEAAAAAGLPVAISIAGTSLHPPTTVGYVDTIFESYANAPHTFQGQIAGLVYSGIFERCPGLRFVLLESGWTWLPALMWKLDQEWKAFRREIPWIDRPPSEYVRRHFRLTGQPADAPADADALAQVLRQLGSDELLLHASAYPHVYDDGADRLLAALDEEQARRFLWQNAADCYGLDARVPA
jgi:predicted TIM-barrel fold metal-dependent hydrolase